MIDVDAYMAWLAAAEFKCAICGTIAEGTGPVCGSPACQAKAEVAETIWGPVEVGSVWAQTLGGGR